MHMEIKHRTTHKSPDYHRNLGCLMILVFALTCSLFSFACGYLLRAATSG